MLPDQPTPLVVVVLPIDENPIHLLLPLLDVTRQTAISGEGRIYLSSTRMDKYGWIGRRNRNIPNSWLPMPMNQVGWGSNILMDVKATRSQQRVHMMPPHDKY
jgi:hypothetical protein